MKEQLLSVQTISTDKELKIFHSQTLSMSPAYPLFLKGVAFLIENKFVDSSINWSDDSHGAVYATVDNVVVAQLVYQKNNSLLFTIVEGYVAPEFRRLGIYTLLNSHLEDVARQLKCYAIGISVHVDNSVGVELSKKIGFNPISYKMRKVL